MAEPKQITLTIEGRQATVPEGTSMLEAAKTVGVLIPHYCYHPGLPVAGVCRMCLVEVEKAPKLAPACATAVAEGQVVHVHSEKAREARKGVLEFLLINHPLDCPICDQAGECELQDYTYQEGRNASRLRDAKRFNPVEDFGGDVVYVPNRCILCTRCVRFMDDVAHEPALNVSERGDRALVGKFEGKDLTHPWAGNVVELCPVGALLSKDHLNKARAWELDRAASICPNCTQGCNTIIETRDNVVVRMRPRANPDVNEYFMCDYGRLNYRWLNGPSRLDVPMIAGGGALVEAEWEPALRLAADTIRGRRIVALVSPSLSNEELFLLRRLIDRAGGTGVFRVRTGPEAPLDGVPDLALRADRAANVVGAELLGFSRSERPLDGLSSADVLLVADAAVGEEDAAAIDRVGAIVVLATTLSPALGRATVALPIANVAEAEGTFTNVRGRVQRFLQAKAAPGAARPGYFVISDLLDAIGGGGGFHLPAAVFDSLAAEHAEYRGLSYAALGLRGAMVTGAGQLAGGAEHRR
ncbi:MAG TPA: 2Fe-2S iron-sulfur cluster-binding protein [Gemmatimonadaceae bacterium]|nr:2Fe-2S iron-sulfur cluster-binding protein [Gemmatimonadaceae bacterium]